ncbi:MAG: hypothetical protein HQK77_18515 [Desulfobacterales bacterium]|nr:hypothetical protein [Desulfobacterales bacterium]
MEDKINQYKAYIREHMRNIVNAWHNLQPKLTGDFWLNDRDWNVVDRLIKIHEL